MKRIFILNFFISFTLVAQIPSGYYNTATGTGYTLKTQLRNIIVSGHIDRGYDALYNAYTTTDTDLFYENDNSVLDMYSENPTGADPYNYQHNVRLCGTYTSENQCYNREHIFPQGFFNSNAPMVSDAHHITPTDGYVNNRRSNYPFGKVNSPTWTSQNGSKVGPSATTGYSGTVFEPINEFKGDIARMLLYFAVRYENEVLSGGWDAHNSAPENTLDGTKTQFYEEWYIKLLLTWHLQDPVSSREISRNNAVYTYQGNRNPFIDNQDYAMQIWGHLIDTEAPSIPANLSFSNLSYTSLTLTWSAATDNIAVTGYEVYKNDVLLATTANLTYNVSGLTSNTNYTFKVRAKDASNNFSSYSNTVSPTTLTDTTPPTTPTNLSGTNITFSSVNLSWTSSTDNVGVFGYDVYKDDLFLATTSNTSYLVSSLTPSTTYSFKVRAKDAANNYSDFSSVLNITTLSNTGGGTVTELFISEYIEGSSNNKAIEIANYTGVSINLSNYSIKKQANGAGSWGNALVLSGTLANNSVYVIANSSASLAVTDLAQLKVNGAPIDFNGNDPIGLFKNGVLIDIVGVLNVTTNFAADITLRRKSSVTAPNTSYTISEWDSYPTDTFSGLGNHTITLSVNEYLNNKFTVYPNPTKNQTLFIYVDNIIQLKSIEVIEMTGKTIQSFVNPIIKNNIFKLSNLPTGFYILKIETDQGMAHKKIIVH